MSKSRTVANPDKIPCDICCDIAVGVGYTEDGIQVLLCTEHFDTWWPNTKEETDR